MGDQYATSAETLYSCGAFYLSDYESLETWIMKKNPENYDADNVFIDTISRIYNAEAAVNGPEMIKRGEIDEAPSAPTFWTAGWPTIPPRTWSPWIVPTPTTPTSTCSTSCPLHTSSPTGALRRGCRIRTENWAKAINNTNFRKAFLIRHQQRRYAGCQRTSGYDSYKLNTITPPNFCATTDGVDYTQCGGLAGLTEFFDEAKAKEYRDAAIEELTAQGVTFPIKVQLPYNPSTTDWDKQCQVLKQQLEGVLNDGTDFIDIIITAGPSDSFLSAVRRNGKFEFLLCNWGADYSDPETETDPFYQAEDSRGMRYAYLRTGVEDGFITGETADAVMAT